MTKLRAEKIAGLDPYKSPPLARLAPSWRELRAVLNEPNRVLGPKRAQRRSRGAIAHATKAQARWPGRICDHRAKPDGRR